jgi:branched-chain amino acid transport system permease protein
MSPLSPFWEATLTSAAINATITQGLYVSNSAGALSVAHAALAGMGGYLAGVLTRNFDVPFVPSVLIGAALGFATGALLAALTLRMNPLVAGLTTLAFGETMVVLAFNIDYIGGAQTLYGIPPYTTLANALIVLVIVVLIAWRFDRSRAGLAARACRDDTVAAAATGVSVPWVKIFAFSLGGAIAAAGGAMRAHYILVQSPADLGFATSVTFVIFWVFGGSYSIWGPIVGAGFLTILPEALRFSSEDRFMVYSAILVAMIIARPQGMIRRLRTGENWRGVVTAQLFRARNRFARSRH